MTSPAPIPSGWYPDPEREGFERRWDGSAWIGTPHQTPAKPSMFGAAYDRAYWTNANRPAGIARWTNIVGVLPFLALALSRVADSVPFIPILLVLALIAVPSGITTIVLAAFGLTRARRGAGAFVLSLQVLISACVLLLLTMLALAILAALPLGS